MSNDVLIKRLVRLINHLEEKADRGNDWALARNLEDRIGSGALTTDEDLSKAESLLRKYEY